DRTRTGFVHHQAGACRRRPGCDLDHRGCRIAWAIRAQLQGLRSGAAAWPIENLRVRFTGGFREPAMKSLIAAFVVFALSSGFAATQARAAGPATDCDRFAASPYDNDRPPSVPGVAAEKIDPKVAVAACEAALKATPNDPRVMFQLGRAYNADGN